MLKDSGHSAWRIILVRSSPPAVRCHPPHTGTRTGTAQRQPARGNGRLRWHAGSATPPTWQWLQLLCFMWMFCMSAAMCVSPVSLEAQLCLLSALWNVIPSLVSVDLFCHFKLPWVYESVWGLPRSSLSLRSLISLRRHSPIVVGAFSLRSIGWRLWGRNCWAQHSSYFLPRGPFLPRAAEADG